jgi:hypothetical protein
MVVVRTLTTSKKTRGGNPRQRAIAAGYRSGLEEQTAEDLTSRGVGYQYEERVIEYVKPQKKSKYTPDFELPNGIIVETKGRFVTADRQKHLLVKQQHPQLDIRFVFSNSKTRISKASATTYAMWCEKNGFKFADKRIPDSWIKETK